MDGFASGRNIRAADLNRLSSDAARKGLAGSAYLAHSNGFELVQRNPRRTRGGGGAAAPLPFTLRVRSRVAPEWRAGMPAGDVTRRELWCLLPQGMLSGGWGPVWRNGAPVPYAGVDGDEALRPTGERDGDWVCLAQWAAGSLAHDLYAVVAIGPASASPDPEWPSNKVSGASRWTVSAVAANAMSGAARPDCAIAFGAVRAGSADAAAETWHRGPFVCDWTETDEEAALAQWDAASGTQTPLWPLSVTRDDRNRSGHAPHGALGIYDFHDPSPLAVPDAAEEWPEGMADDTVLLRHRTADGHFEVAYLPLGSVAKGDGDGAPPSGPNWPTLPEPDPDCAAVADANPEHFYVWDSCRQTWVRVTTGAANGAGLDARYWRLGGGAAVCHGSAIGDNNGNTVIDLSKTTLQRAWHADDLTAGALTLPHGAVLTVDGDVYVPTNVTINGVNYKILAKQ